MPTPNVLFRAKYYTRESKEYNFYSSQDSSKDYLQYVSTGIRQGEVKDFLDYTGNPEKSSGPFSVNGILDSKDRKEIREALRSTKAQIWSCLLSFEEEFGKKHLKNWRDAKDIIEAEFPKFLRENNIKYDNVIWFAGMHENTDNRHIHICFFEKEPLRIIANTKEVKYHEGTLKKISMDNLKIRVEQRMTGVEYEIKSSRNSIVDQTEDYLNQLVDPSVEFDKTLKLKLMNIYRKLPQGDFGYESRALDSVRDEIDDITTHYLMNEPRACLEYVNLLKRLSDSDKKTRIMCDSQHMNPEPYMIAPKFKKDLYRRIGNRIIKYVKNARCQESGIKRQIDPEKKQRWDEKKRLSFLFGRVAHLSYEVNQDRNEAFEEFERLMAEAEFERESKEAEVE